MYDELVRRLREDVPKAISNFDYDFVEDWIKVKRSIKEAADAIEELSKLADAIPHVCECCIGCEMERKNGGCDNAFVLSPKRAREYLSKPRWIPVTEKPPLKVGDDGYNGYLVYANGYYEVADYTTSKFDNVPYFYVNGEYEPDVTHYMPLPEPPQEE